MSLNCKPTSHCALNLNPQGGLGGGRGLQQPFARFVHLCHHLLPPPPSFLLLLLLQAMFPEGGLDRLVAQQPYLLMADVDEVVGKMEMCVWLCGGGGGRASSA